MLADYIIISINEIQNNPLKYNYFVEDENGYHQSLSNVSKKAFNDYEEFLLEQLDMVNKIKSQGN